MLSELDNADKHRALVVTGLIVTQQAITLRHRQMKDVFAQVSTVNSAYRDGDVIAALKADDMEIDDVQASTLVAFGDAPAKNAEVVSTLAAIADYVEGKVIPSLKQWLV